jgi:predicted DsbA family dithiol-disulfide isomerase
MTKRLNGMGAPYGLAFRKIVNISNSRQSLEAGEFAKELGRFDRFHRTVFEAYFAQGKDIGDLDVLTQLGEQAGLDPDKLRNALLTGSYRRALDEVRDEAARLGVTAAPTFLFNGKERVVGAQPIEVFRERLRSFR